MLGKHWAFQNAFEFNSTIFGSWDSFRGGLVISRKIAKKIQKMNAH
jgi:hypothetical protein